VGVEVIQLPRGGTLIKTPAGMLQVGATPETIKDSLHLLGDVPDSFVLPNKLFSAERGVSLADIEFPTYFNYFLKKRCVKVIGQAHQIETIFGVLKEAIFGPEFVNLAREYPFGANNDLIPNLRAEMEFLRAKDLSGKRKMELPDIAVGIPWGPSNRVPFGGLASNEPPGACFASSTAPRFWPRFPLMSHSGPNDPSHSSKSPSNRHYSESPSSARVQVLTQRK